MKISYANEIAAVCDSIGADAGEVLQGLGLDHRVGSQFLRPGPGYGGSCLPKDVRALAWKARKTGVRLDLLPAAVRANTRQRHRLLAKLASGLGGDVGHKRIAVWGLAFKAGTDDLRGAASLDLVPQLLELGAHVCAHDPAAMPGFARQFPLAEWPGLELASGPMDTLEGADALLILTEWEQFRAIPPSEIARRMAGRLVVDGRNLLDPEGATRAGLSYRGVGRGRVR